MRKKNKNCADEYLQNLLFDNFAIKLLSSRIISSYQEIRIIETSRKLNFRYIIFVKQIRPFTTIIITIPSRPIFVKSLNIFPPSLLILEKL